MKFCFALIAIITLSGCMTAVYDQPAMYRQGSSPEPNQITTVAVGDTMVERFDYSAKSRAILKKSAPGNPLRMRKSAAAGTELRGGVSSGDPTYCIRGWGNPCFKDLDNDGAFDVALTQNAYGDVLYSEEIEPVPYKLQEVSMGRGYRNELVYQGLDQNVVKIIYREYQRSLVQADKSQVLSYTLNSQDQATPVSFRGAKIEILKADNNAITFKVLQGL